VTSDDRHATGMSVTGWRCAACGAERRIDEIMPWRCPSASTGDAVADARHVLVPQRARVPLVRTDDPNPFVAHDADLAWSATAAALGMSATARAALVRDVDDLIARVDGTGFHVTPFLRSDGLSDALGFSDGGGVWVKDETHQVAGSQKARHLVTILLHLRSLEELGLAPWTTVGGRPPLAIASCGNAAYAAATLAAACAWPISVFVPPTADAAVLDRLLELGADVRTCPRRVGDPPGDPCVHAFRDAVAAGAVPFGVQGPENALCLDGGRTMGWEIALQARAAGIELDRVFVQVGGGAFAACVGAGLLDVVPNAVPDVVRGAVGDEPHRSAALYPVQAAGCAPLARAWETLRVMSTPVHAAGVRWSEVMWPWDAPASFADGILDDETYDWIGVLAATEATGGVPVVAPEDDIVAAHRLVHDVTGVDASPTGTAGLAGVITARASIGDDERVAVVLSGVQRGVAR
jgi:threonine synthase